MTCANEEADAYRQMRLEGMSVAAIARVSGTKRAGVDQAIAVAENELALAVAAKHGLSLEQASAIAEFCLMWTGGFTSR